MRPPAVTITGASNRPDEEMDNLRSAFGWSIETGDIGRALELASSLQPLWLSRGRIQEGLAWFDAVLTERASQVASTSHLDVRARVLADKAVLDAWVNNYNLSDAEQALAIARELDDPALLARALTACGSAAVYDAEVAAAYFAEAIAWPGHLGDQWRLSQILGQQAQAAFVAGDPIAVRAAAEEGRDLADAIGDRFGFAPMRVAARQRPPVRGRSHRERSPSCAGWLPRPMPITTRCRRSPRSSCCRRRSRSTERQSAARAAAESAIESAAELGDVYLGADLHRVDDLAPGRR